LLHYVESAQLQLKEVSGKIPFSSSYKYMATMHPEKDQAVIFIKGAPEVLMQKAVLTEKEKQQWQQAASNLAQRANEFWALLIKK
jgi:magnesium-transporting ATPase (P-type)